MRAAFKTWLLLTCAVLWTAGAIAPAAAAGACSPFLGLASLNEFFKDRTNQANDPDDFVEIKLLDQSIPFATYSQWSLQVCEHDGAGNNNDADGCSSKITIGAFTDTVPPWLTLKDGSIGRFFNFKTGFDAILLDANDDVIDYLSVDGRTQLEQPGCTGAALAYDYQAGAPGSSDKFIFRTPDGTGDWDSATSAAADPTEDSSNDNDPSLPTLTFSQPRIIQGTTVATITVTLSSASSDVITIDFNTFDDSLIAGTDYTALTTTRSFAAGQTSLSIDVTVSAASDVGQFKFFIGMNSASPGLAAINSHVGIVTVIAATVDNFLIDVGGGNANTCNPFSFSVTVRDSNNNPVTNYGGSISITTSTGNGNFSAVTATNSVSPNPDNDDNGNASYTFDPLDNGSVTLAIANEHAETLSISVNDASIPLGGTSGNIVFRDNAFSIVDNDALVAGDNVPVAGRNHAYQVQMIRKDPVNGCGVASGYDGVKALQMWRTQSAADPSPSAPLFAGTSLPNAEPGATNGSITFTNGVADVFLETSDIGQFAIELADISLGFAEIPILGTSMQQTVRPFGLAATALEAGAAPPTANPGGSAPTDPIFTRAGHDFSATVAAVLWNALDDTDNDGLLDTGVYADNAIVPSYAWDTTLEVSAAGFTPLAGAPGVLNNNTVFLAEFAAGEFTVADLQYSEVGSFTLRASAVDFLGAALADIVGDDIVVGRFVPDRFELAVTDHGVFEDVCTTFTYIGDDFGYATAPVLRVTALNLQGNITTNYLDDGAGEDFMMLDANSITLDASQDEAALGTDSNPLLVSYIRAPMTFALVSGGIIDFSLGADVYRYGPDSPVSFSKFGNSQVAPFTADIDSAITAISDGEVSSVLAVTLSPAATALGTRFGRLRMDNVHGSELNALQMPVFTEFWNGFSFQKNNLDTCTVIAAADLVSVANPAGLSVPAVVNAPASAGDIDYSYPAPGASNAGYVDTTTDLSAAAQLWLRYDTDADGDFDDDPSARATFGIFDGNPVQIYIEQVYQ